MADGNVPFQIPAAVSRFKFRRSDGLSLIKPPLSAELHKAIINIKRLRRQAVTAIYINVKFSKAVYGSWSGTLTVKAKKSIFKRVSVKSRCPFFCVFIADI